MPSKYFYLILCVSVLMTLTGCEIFRWFITSSNGPAPVDEAAGGIAQFLGPNAWIPLAAAWLLREGGGLFMKNKQLAKAAKPV